MPRPQRRSAWCVVAVALAVFVAAVSPAAAQGDDEPVATDPGRQLAERFAPVIMLKAQEHECDADGEPYGPAAVDIVLDNPGVALRQLGPGDPVVRWGPGAADLHGLGEGFYLDFPGGALEPGCLYERDFRRFTADHPPTVYAHIVQDGDHPGELALQYWIYWYYNDWNNKHESDWEMIQLVFEASSVEEALASEPVSVGYAQHEGGERAGWDADKLEREGDRPVVYSSAGSHASYFGSAVYLGRSGSEGFGCDNTDGPSTRVAPEVVLLPDRVDDPDDPLAWLGFEGRWGERQSGPFNGPTGPVSKDRWTDAFGWADELRPSSVVIPAGDSAGAEVILFFCDVVAWGSGVLIGFTTSPLRLLVAMAAFAVGVRWLTGRTDWSPVPATPLRRRRRAGQIIRAAAVVYRRHASTVLRFGLVLVPTALVVALLGGLIAWLPVIGDVLGLAGRQSGTSLSMALLAGGLPAFAAFTVVNALVAVRLDDLDGTTRSARECARRVWHRRRALAAAFIRTFVVVYVLLLTIVGIPWAIRQAVRYQFTPQAVMLDGAGGKEALARSSELVRGRWWHTAVIVLSFHAVGIAAGMVVGLLILVLFSGLPLWLFSALVTLVQAFVTPFTATAQTLLYGDAVAERDGLGAPTAVGASRG